MKCTIYKHGTTHSGQAALTLEWGGLQRYRRIP